jgi:hypothetical protein
MRIAEIEVENFRCLRKVAFSCGPLTALIGGQQHREIVGAEGA